MFNLLDYTLLLITHFIVPICIVVFVLYIDYSLLLFNVEIMIIIIINEQMTTLCSVLLNVWM